MKSIKDFYETDKRMFMKLIKGFMKLIKDSYEINKRFL